MLRCISELAGAVIAAYVFPSFFAFSKFRVFVMRISLPGRIGCRLPEGCPRRPAGAPANPDSILKACPPSGSRTAALLHLSHFAALLGAGGEVQLEGGLTAGGSEVCGVKSASIDACPGSFVIILAWGVHDSNLKRHDPARVDPGDSIILINLCPIPRTLCGPIYALSTCDLWCSRGGLCWSHGLAGGFDPPPAGGGGRQAG